MRGVINAAELRGSLLGVLRRVRGGERITVIYRKRPAFRIVPPPSTTRCYTVPEGVAALDPRVL